MPLVRIALAFAIVFLVPVSSEQANGSEAYARPFGPHAPWNIPVAKVPRHPNSQYYVKKLWQDSPSSHAGNFNLSFDEYTYPVYSVRDATKVASVKLIKPEDEGPRYLDIPWNWNWQPAWGTDAQIIVLDPDRGIEWDLWQVRYEGLNVIATSGSRVAGDYRTMEDGNRLSRGIGVPYLAMLVRPQEIMDGDIRHALSLTARNTDGAFAVPPATKLEFPNRLFGGVPTGMRFALDVNDQDIAAWLKELPPKVRRSAAIIARALRDYGWFVTDTAGGAHFQFESSLTGGKAWHDLGLDDFDSADKHFPRDLLDGLLTPERIYATVPSDEYPADLLAPPYRMKPSR